MIHDTRTPLERAIARRHLLQMLGLTAAYVLVLIASIDLLKGRAFSPALTALIAVTPALPLFGVVAVTIQFLLSIDELQRQMHLEALAIAAGVTAALAITYTFLEGVGLPHSQAWWFFACIDAVWACSLPFVRRRYM